MGNDAGEPGNNKAGCISIHVPSWGTTKSPQVINAISGYFNPRSLVGNDDVFHDAALRDLISIHVPSWGTTDFVRILYHVQLISIHVPSWGTTANFHKYSLFFYAINIIFLLFIIPSLFSLVLFMLLF